MWYPQEATWLGTTVPHVRDALGAQYSLIHLVVPMSTVDHYVANAKAAPNLIKIDTEGNELDVLRGSALCLSEHRPIVVFETWSSGPRDDVFDELSAKDYGVWPLTGLRHWTGHPCSRDQFRHALGMNFVAFPSGMYDVVEALRDTVRHHAHVTHKSRWTTGRSPEE